MKIKNGFILRKVAGMTVVTATDSFCDFDGMITLNESAELMWKKLEEGTTLSNLIDVLLKEYDVDECTAKEDVQAFIDVLANNGIIDESSN